MDIREPEITHEDILILKDDHFNTNNVCIVTGSGTGIGRATAIAAAANNLMAVGLDVNEEEGVKTQKMAREMGGQMIFVKTDLCQDADVEHAIAEAAKLGNIKYLANIAGIQHIDSVENFPMEKYDLMQRLMLRAPFPRSYLHQKQTGLQYYQIWSESLEPIHSRRRRRKNPFLYDQHRICQNRAGTEPDTSPGRAARNYPGRGCQRCYDGSLARKGNDDADRSCQSFRIRVFEICQVPDRRGSVV